MTKPLFEVFRESMLANPNGSRREAQDSFVAAMKTDPAYLDMLAIDYFTRMSAVYVVKQAPLGSVFGRTDVSQDKNERTAAALVSRAAAVGNIEDARAKRDEASQRTQSAFADLKAKIRDVILLDLTLPNGKALRQSTGAECTKAGGFFAEVAKHVKPRQVVDRHLTEAELQNIRARFYQRNAAKSAQL